MFTMTETPLRERKMTEDRDYSLFFRVEGSSIHYWFGGICEPCHIIHDYVYHRASLWLLTQLEGEISQLNQITPPHIQPTPSLRSFTQARTLHLLLLILNMSQKHSPSCISTFLNRQSGKSPEASSTCVYYRQEDIWWGSQRRHITRWNHHPSPV